MAALDFKKDRKDLYLPATAPAIVDVPEMLFVMADGAGDPNTSASYREAIQILYGLAYAIRMNKAEEGYVEFVVPPLEGFWDFSGHEATFGAGQAFDKNSLVWTSAIRLPGFVTHKVFET